MGDFCENTAGGTGEQASWAQAALLARFLSKGGGCLACQRWCWWQIGHVRGGVVKQGWHRTVFLNFFRRSAEEMTFGFRKYETFGCWALVLGLCRSARTELASS